MATVAHTLHIVVQVALPNFTAFRAARKYGYRSGLEHKLSIYLDELNITYDYENIKIEWEDLAYRTYTPDFVLYNGIIIETKGRLLQKDARKHRAIKKQHPELDIRFVFTDINKRVENSKFTNYQWCQKYGFEYSERVIPQEWIEHGTNKSNRKRVDKPRKHRTRRAKGK